MSIKFTSEQLKSEMNNYIDKNIENAENIDIENIINLIEHKKCKKDADIA